MLRVTVSDSEICNNKYRPRKLETVCSEERVYVTIKSTATVNFISGVTEGIQELLTIFVTQRIPRDRQSQLRSLVAWGDYVIVGRPYGTFIFIS